MDKFQRAALDPAQVADIRDHLQRVYTSEKVEQLMRDSFEGNIWLNDTYQVVERRFWNEALKRPMVHLSIKRRDREIIRDWRDLQEIKNELVGPDCEAVELFPDETRLVDTSNQYHLWALAEPGLHFPFGFFGLRAVSGETVLPDLPRAKQRER